MQDELKESIERGATKVKLALADMPALAHIREHIAHQKPFKDKNILGCVTVTPETAALIITLDALGVKHLRWCSDNKYATDDDVANYLRSRDYKIFAKANMTDDEYFDAMREATQFKDSERQKGITIIDDGCDITEFLLEENADFLNDVDLIVEQTTCGVNKFRKLYQANLIPCPTLNINDSSAKRLFDNYYGVRESFLHALMNTVPQQLSGKKVAIFGYGPVGEGTAKAMKALGCNVYIVEASNLRQAQAHFEGFIVESKEEALRQADIVVLATGCNDVVTQQDFQHVKDNAILCNIGHGNEEFDYDFLVSGHEKSTVNDHLDMIALQDKNIFVMSQGALANMIAGKGNPPMVMSLTFCLHILAIMDFQQTPEKYPRGHFYDLGEDISERALALNHPELEAKRTILSDDQLTYLAKTAYTPRVALPISHTDRFNTLANKPAKIQLGRFPTRLVRNAALSDELDVDLFLKMECEADFIGSGNKVRKLEYLMHAAKAEGVTDLIIDGSTSSNSCMALAYYAQKFEIKSHCILSGQQTYQGNHALIMRYASNAIHIGSWSEDKIAQAYMRLEQNLARNGAKSWRVPTGVSNTLTAFAGFDLMEEIMMQARDAKLSVDHIIVPAGTGSTLTGFDMAQHVHGENLHMHGAAIANDERFFRDQTAQTYRQLADQGVGDFTGQEQSRYSIQNMVGPGYGKNKTKDLTEIDRIERLSGVFFDSTYMFKTYQSIARLLEEKRIQRGESVVLLHTGGMNERFGRCEVM